MRETLMVVGNWTDSHGEVERALRPYMRRRCTLVGGAGPAARVAAELWIGRGLPTLERATFDDLGGVPVPDIMVALGQHPEVKPLVRQMRKLGRKVVQHRGLRVPRVR